MTWSVAKFQYPTPKCLERSFCGRGGDVDAPRVPSSSQVVEAAVLCGPEGFVAGSQCPLASTKVVESAALCGRIMRPSGPVSVKGWRTPKRCKRISKKHVRETSSKEEMMISMWRQRRKGLRQRVRYQSILTPTTEGRFGTWQRIDGQQKEKEKIEGRAGKSNGPISEARCRGDGRSKRISMCNLADGGLGL